jgi:hypothetical protein
MTLPARCRKCDLTLMDSLDIAVHIGRLGRRYFRSSLIYPCSKRCPKLARKKDIGN